MLCKCWLLLFSEYKGCSPKSYEKLRIMCFFSASVWLVLTLGSEVIPGVKRGNVCSGVGRKLRECGGKDDIRGTDNEIHKCSSGGYMCSWGTGKIQGCLRWLKPRICWWWHHEKRFTWGDWAWGVSRILGWHVELSKKCCKCNCGTWERGPKRAARFRSHQSQTRLSH